MYLDFLRPEQTLSRFTLQVFLLSFWISFKACPILPLPFCCSCWCHLKAGTSEAFGETWMRSGTNLFSVFSCVGSFRSRTDVVCFDSTCKVWGGWLLAVWAIGFSDWSYSKHATILIGGVLANQRDVWEGRNTVCALFFYACRSVISCFHVAPHTYCISHKRRTYTLLWSWQHVEAGCSVQLFGFRQETTEWLDEGSWLLVLVWAVCGGCYSQLKHRT